MMDLSAPRAPVHTDQYQGMQTHLTTVRVSHLTFYNCYAVSTRFVSVTVKQSTIYVTGWMLVEAVCLWLVSPRTDDKLDVRKGQSFNPILTMFVMRGRIQSLFLPLIWVLNCSAKQCQNCGVIFILLWKGPWLMQQPFPTAQAIMMKIPLKWILVMFCRWRFIEWMEILVYCVFCLQVVMKAVLLGATGKVVANVTPTATVPTCLTPAPTSVTVRVFTALYSLSTAHSVFMIMAQ